MQKLTIKAAREKLMELQKKMAAYDLIAEISFRKTVR